MILQVNVEETEEMVWQLPPQQFRSHLTNVSETETYSNYTPQYSPEKEDHPAPFLSLCHFSGKAEKVGSV